MQEVGEAPPLATELVAKPQYFAAALKQISDFERLQHALSRREFVELQQWARNLDDGSEVARFMLGFLLLPENLLYPELDKRKTVEEVTLAAQTHQRFVHVIGYLNQAEPSNESERLAELTYATIKLQEHILFIGRSANVTLPLYWNGMRGHAALVTAFDKVYLPTGSLGEVGAVDVSRKIDGVGVVRLANQKDLVFLFDSKYEGGKESMWLKRKKVNIASLPQGAWELANRLSPGVRLINHLTIEVPGAKLSRLQVPKKDDEYPYLAAVKSFARLEKGARKMLVRGIEGVIMQREG